MCVLIPVLFIKIFWQDIVTAGRVSRSWYRVSRDELLWKVLFKRDWNINPKIDIAPGKVGLFLKIMFF